MKHAYDQVNLHFLLHMLTKFQFPHRWVSWITKCIINIDQIQKVRGHWQGCLLSAYLFIIYYDYLTSLIKNSSLKNLSNSKECPLISHLLHANDILIFAKATNRNIKIIKTILKQYNKTRGKKVNNKKVVVFFNKNIKKRNVSNQDNNYTLKPCKKENIQRSQY